MRSNGKRLLVEKRVIRCDALQRRYDETLVERKAKRKEVNGSHPEP